MQSALQHRTGIKNNVKVSQANVNLATEVALVRVKLPGSSALNSKEEAREGQLRDIAAQLIQVDICSPCGGTQLRLACHRKHSMSQSSSFAHDDSSGTNAAQVLAENGFQVKLRDRRQGNAAAAAIVQARRDERVRCDHLTLDATLITSTSDAP